MHLLFLDVGGVRRVAEQATAYTSSCIVVTSAGDKGARLEALHTVPQVLSQCFCFPHGSAGFL